MNKKVLRIQMNKMNKVNNNKRMNLIKMNKNQTLLQ
jgi:hypothetical protein